MQRSEHWICDESHLVSYSSFFRNKYACVATSNCSKAPRSYLRTTGKLEYPLQYLNHQAVGLISAKQAGSKVK